MTQQHWCEYCGAPMDLPPPEPVKIGDCELLSGPGHPTLIYGSRKVALAPQEAAVISLLSKRTYVSSEVLGYIISPDSENPRRVLHAVLHTLKHKLTDNQLPLAIVSLGQGGKGLSALYQLDIKPRAAVVDEHG